MVLESRVPIIVIKNTLSISSWTLASCDVSGLGKIRWMVSFGGATSSSLPGVGNGIKGVSAALWGDLALRCSGTVVSLSI